MPFAVRAFVDVYGVRLSRFVGVFDFQRRRFVVRGDGHAAFVRRVFRHRRRRDGLRVRLRIRVVRVGLRLVVVVFVVVAVVVACGDGQGRQAAQGDDATEDCPRAPACATRFDQDDAGKAGVTTERLAGGNVVGQHVHGIRLLGAFRDVGVERAVLVLAHQQVFAAVGIQSVVVVDNQARRFDALAFKGDVEVVADPLGHDVLGTVLGLQVGELVVNVIHSADMHRASIARVDVDLIDDVCAVVAAFDFG